MADSDQYCISSVFSVDSRDSQSGYGPIGKSFGNVRGFNRDHFVCTVFQPEQNQDLRNLISSKYTSIVFIYGIRVILSMLIGGILLLIYMEVMRYGNCEMEMGKYFFGVLAEFLAFGGIGILAYALSDNLIIGYMAPIIYYVIAYGGGEKYLKKFYPFAMTTDYETKYVLFAVGVICMIAGIVIRGKRQR